MQELKYLVVVCMVITMVIVLTGFVLQAVNPEIHKRVGAKLMFLRVLFQSLTIFFVRFRIRFFFRDLFFFLKFYFKSVKEIFLLFINN
jgi:hypothetical protein